MVLCTACLFIAATPAKQTIANKKIAEISQPSNLIHHTFHRNGVAGDNGRTYNVTLDFNLSTQTFGVINAYDITIPATLLTLTVINGTGTTLNGNGSTIEITNLFLTINGTSVELFIENDDSIVFDY